jgi:hypothetical protein
MQGPYTPVKYIVKKGEVMLKQEEWDALSPEEQTARASEKPVERSGEQKEDMVIIDGKPRPLKNFMAELSRKTKDEVMAEINANKKPDPVVNTQQAPDNLLKRINEMAEEEMTRTGSLLPVGTVLNLINKGVEYQLGERSKTTKNAQKMIKDTKKELKSLFKDYSDYSDRFDEICDDIEPQNISKDGLKLIFNALRGEKTDDLVKKAKEDAQKEAEEGKVIIGEVSSGSSGAPISKSTKLSTDQKKEALDMGFDSEEDYLGRLNKKREVFKKKGYKNVPNLMSENAAL